MIRSGISPCLTRIYGLSSLLILLVSLTAHAQGNVRNVVVFFSYGPNLPAFEKFLTGLNSTIRGNTDQPVNILTEYLDMARAVENDDYPKFIVTMYNDKLKEFNVDLLITVGPGINDVLAKYGSSSFKNLNIINVDLDLPGRTSLRDLNIKKGKEIILNFQAKNSLRHVIDLFPDHHNIFVISGVSRLDLFYTSLMRQAKTEFEPLRHFTFVSNLSLDSTLRFVGTIPTKSIVVVPAYLQDAGNVSFSTPEVMELMSKNSSAPVFLGITDGGFRGQGGGIGGYLFSYANLGSETGRMANEILNGKPIESVTYNENSFYAHMYDWKELQRWNLTNSKAIPSTSLFYNRSTSFLESYKWYILGVILFITSQTLLIAYLFRLNRRQRAITEKMLVTEGMYRSLIHTDRLSKMSILTASLSHELFQPLAAIRATAQAGKQFVLTDRLDADKASNMFENILEDETRATKLIRSVRSLMKEETVGKERVNLNALIDETLEIIGAEAERDGITTSVVLEPQPVFVLGDRIQLQQVLMNFIRNATAAMENNKRQAKFLEVALRLEKDEAVVSVKDSGPGLDPTVKENLFKPFVSTKKEGFGIGLALCKSLIEKHNGKIWADSVPGGGAIFAFSLPVMKK